MKAILKFQLPDEQSEFKDAQDGTKLRCLLWELDQHLRNEIKHNNKPYEEVRTFLHECLDGYDLKIDQP